jgi:hypothetical protein
MLMLTGAPCEPNAVNTAVTTGMEFASAVLAKLAKITTPTQRPARNITVRMFDLPDFLSSF